MTHERNLLLAIEVSELGCLGLTRARADWFQVVSEPQLLRHPNRTKRAWGSDAPERQRSHCGVLGIDDGDQKVVFLRVAF